MRRTPLYEIHKKLKARFTPFAGWSMPLQYTSVIEEVKAVRKEAGLFDISHMGRLLVKGREAKERLQYLTTNNLNKLKPGKVQYNLLTNEKGGVRDDITVYMLSEEEFFICCNAVNKDKVISHLSKYVHVEDLSEKLIQFAIQGPRSAEILSRYYDIGDLKFYNFRTFGEVIISRTGYTGEDGFEVYAPPKEGIKLFIELLKEVKPCGLGARDVLRIEAGFPLYGHEISEDITPLEANLDRFVDLSKDFLGKEEMLKKPLKRKLYGLVMVDRGIPREGYPIYKQGEEIGTVSSGTFSPTLNRGIALCFVELPERKEGNPVEVKIRERLLRAELKSYPFVRKAK
ncbi:glycine cleavage system aminomethyltransferase GcvT [Aquifex sp.]